MKVTGKSDRVCQRCVATLSRLAKDLVALQQWKDLCCPEPLAVGDSTETNTDKRGREPTPSKTPRALKKICPSPLSPGVKTASSQKNITEVIINYPSKKITKVCDPEEAHITTLLAQKKWKAAANKIIKHDQLFEEIKKCVLEVIDKECSRACNPTAEFVLRKSSPEDLKSFSFSKLESDLQRHTPFLLSVIHCVTKKSRLTTCAAASIALRGRQPCLSAFSHYLNSILQYGGAKKSDFTRFSKMSITTSHQAAMVKQRELAATCGDGVRLLKRQIEQFLNTDNVLRRGEEISDVFRSMEDLCLSVEKPNKV